MINLSKKLYISLLTLVLLVVLAGTITFAWFELNKNAWFSDLGITASSDDNLQISIDGQTWGTNLDVIEIEKAVLKNSYGFEIKQGTKKNSEGEDVPYTYLYDPYEGEVYDDKEEIDSLMKKVVLRAVTSKDGKNFFSRPVTKYDELTDKNITTAGAQLRDTDKQYIKFDLYFKTDNQIQTVYFANRDRVYSDRTIKGTKFITDSEDSLVSWLSDNSTKRLTNSFATFNSSNGNILNYVATFGTLDDGSYGFKGGKFDGMTDDESKEYADKFIPKVSNAVRMSTYLNDDTTTMKIYEPNKGYGSYATSIREKDVANAIENYVGTAYTTGSIEGAYSAAYDSSKNAAFTYYNNVRKYENDQETGVDLPMNDFNFNSIMPAKVYTGFDTVESAEILTLNESNGYGMEGQVKATFTIWLEGWDADCIDAVLDQQLNISMSFTNYETAIETTPISITYLTTNPTTGSIIEGLTKTNKQVQNMNVSDNTPAYLGESYVGTAKWSFRGWAIADANGNYRKYDTDKKEYVLVDEPVFFDFESNIKPRLNEGTDWYLVSVWEQY